MDIFDTKQNELLRKSGVPENHIPDEIATGGNQTSGPNQITKEIRDEAIRLAESSKGLDIAAFQRKHNISVINVDELLKG